MYIVETKRGKEQYYRMMIYVAFLWVESQVSLSLRRFATLSKIVQAVRPMPHRPQDKTVQKSPLSQFIFAQK